ncbi:MAG: DUF1501 domain-containing protein [Planctomycetaceae bacterium]
MLRVMLGGGNRYCDGVSRRSFLQVGMAGLGALSLGQVLSLKAHAGTAGQKDTSLILIWLDGGPSQHDTYDPKPKAPSEYRGIWRHIPTNVSGIDITEMFPLQAQVADKFSIIRSMHHNSGDHFTGGHWMLTGRGGASGADNTPKSPFFGSIATKLSGARKPGMPALVGVPYGMSIGLRPGYFGGNFLGREFDPFETGGDPNSDKFQVQNLSPIAQLPVDRLESRRALNQDLDRLCELRETQSEAAALSAFDQQAFDLVTGPAARQAFSLQDESESIRDSYGRNPWGQSVLLARRLVEAGSTIVTCHFGGWDSHWNHQGTMEKHLPKVDMAVSGLLKDLDQRGILDKTMVVVCGEFGRTPRMNDGGNGGPPLSQGTPGRDHWGNALSVLVAGGGTKPGQVIGATNHLGEYPAERPLRPGDLHHTIFRVLGVDSEAMFIDHRGRPNVAIDHGAVIEELL